MRTNLLHTTALLLTGVLLVAVAGTADAGERQRSGSYVTGKGRTGTYSSVVSGNRRTGVTNSQSIVTQSGNTYHRSANTNYNRQDGTFNKTVTGANGKTRVYNGTASNGQRSGTYTTGDGNSGSFSSYSGRNPDGSYIRERTLTDQGGNSYHGTVTSRYDSQTGTFVRSVTGPRGNTHEGSVTLTPDYR